MGSKVYITDHFHGNCMDVNECGVPPTKRKLYSKGLVIIKDNGGWEIML